MKVTIGNLKFGIKIFDLGWRIGIRINNKSWRFGLPIPIHHRTIRYSIKEQGLLKSLSRRFRVPLEIQK